MPKRIYTREQMDRMNAKRKEQRKNETPEQKQKRYEGQLDWNKRNPDKIAVYREKNKEEVLENTKKWAKDNPEKCAKISKKWRDANKEKLNAYAKKYQEENKEDILERRRFNTRKKKSEDPIFKFCENVRSLINISFKKYINSKKSKKTEEILGCTLEFFVSYILNLCSPYITLKDFSRYGYHLDHIIPISSAKSQKEVIKLNHYTNFQPLWWRDNIRKSNKISPNNEHLFLIYY